MNFEQDEIQSYRDRKEKLTPLQAAFVREYPKHWNATRAMQDAGYRGRWSGNTWQLLSLPKIQRAIRRQLKPLFVANRRSAEWVLSKLEHLAELGSDEKGAHFDPSSAIRALEQLGKYHKIFAEQVEINVRVDLGEKIMGARKRAKLITHVELEKLDKDKTTTQHLITETNKEIDIESFLQ